MAKISKSEDQWRSELTPEQFRILRQKGTERPFTGPYNDFKGVGTFACAGCGADLFDAATKYNSGSGWPSFTAPASGEALEHHRDTSHGMVRVEITCANCGGHLGHVFPDGPAPTGERYCINSASLSFKGKTGA
ncbi:MAG: peptide-methionine (R)-S-oxide reductase MsrB [Rhodospirillaceae bacterium]|nr:peptide-methionine (R)-S-oxide reductase MsrB [Rhodospirillaceae bacterium]